MQACLRLFYAPPERSRGHLEACEQLLRTWPPLKATAWSAEELLRFLHIVDLNIHKDDERLFAGRALRMAGPCPILVFTDGAWEGGVAGIVGAGL